VKLERFVQFFISSFNFHLHFSNFPEKYMKRLEEVLVYSPKDQYYQMQIFKASTMSEGMGIESTTSHHLVYFPPHGCKL
jgi:hypothetical protein